MCCLALTACKPDKVVNALPTPPERLICVPAGARPTIPAEHIIDWTRVVSVEQAKAEHLKYVATIRSREGVITGYIMRLEGQLFTCHTNVEWRRNYEKGLPAQ
jgi:hypothetical protein